MADCEDLKNQSISFYNRQAKMRKLYINGPEKYKVETHFYDNTIMQNVIDKYKLPESNFVKKQIGIGNVCQAAILAYNERAKIILPKTKFEKVTVSLAWE